MGTRPTGTVTFLFTDIEGSTRLWQTHPAAMRRSHICHDEILSTAIESQGGYIFQVVGDAYCSAFPSAESAVRAAIQAQRLLHAETWGEAPIRVRMGIHTGQADLKQDGQYSGYTTLSRVQRITSVGHGGQALISSAAEQLLRDSPAPDATLRDLGEHRLKDLPNPEHIFQLIIPDLPVNFPPLRTLDSFPNNLPLQLTSFVGREKELADVERLLADTRLLTLTGPGGTGKSRLSLQAAAGLLHTFPHGAWLVELAPVSDPSAVSAAVLAALDLPSEVHRPAIEMLCDHLHEKELLLILDNCEHVVDACARMVDRLLHASPGLRILASSREALGIAGEVSYRVPSLICPDTNSLPALESLSQYEAVKLFIERARAASPGFNVTNDNAPAVAQICHRLDGIPLAIELAAAKLRALSVEQIARRLDDRFRLLTGGSRTAMERHQTLRAALDWSYNFLAPPEQVLFRRVSAFVNGWTLEAAESVCAGEALCCENIFDMLEQLVNKSLVSTEAWKGETRYHMLESMRQYAGEKLIEAGESELQRDRHLAYYLDLAETAAPHLIRTEQVEWLDRLEADHDNLRSALEWSLGKERPEQALRLAGALSAFWHIRCYWKEGLRWLERALAIPCDGLTAAEKEARTRALHFDVVIAENVDDADRMRASAGAACALSEEDADRRNLAISRFCVGFAFHHAGDHESACRLLEQSLAELRLLNEPYWEANCHYGLVNSYFFVGAAGYPEAVARNLEAARRTGERVMVGQALLHSARFASANDRPADAAAFLDEADQLLHEVGCRMPTSGYRGLLAHAHKEYVQARQLYTEAIAVLDLMGERWMKTETIKCLGVLARDEGNLVEAENHFQQALDIAREIGMRSSISTNRAFLGQIHQLQGDFTEAKMDFRESLVILGSGSQKHAAGRALILVAGYLASRLPHLAVRLLSAIHSQDAMQISIPARDTLLRGDFDDSLARARLELGESAFQSAWAEGESLSIEEACGLALNALEDA